MHPVHFWKAGRYKLAAPVLKTGSARAEVGALPTPSAISRFACSAQSHSKLANTQASKTQGMTSMRARME